MKIAIIGAGSIGSLFGSILFKAGQDVTLVEKNQKIVEAIKQHGLHITRGDKTEVLQINITNRIEDISDPDLIMMAVKSYDNVKAAEDCLKIISPNTTVLTLQNGIGNYETISGIIGKQQTLIGTTTFGSTLKSPGNVTSSESGIICIGEPEGGISPRINALADTLRDGGFDVHTTETLNSLIWTKLIVNAAINAIGALTCLRNIDTHDVAPAKKIQNLVISEAKKVADAKGIKLDTDNIYDYVFGVCQSTSTNKASMYQDVERGNPTEVEAINGAIVREGSLLGIETPINYALTQLVLARSHGEH